jgi:hypothetical protein
MSRHSNQSSIKFKRLVPSLIAALFIILGLAYLRLSGAAGFIATSEAEDGVVAGNAAKITSATGASGTAAVKFGTDEPSGPTIYVATNGNDSNNGTSAASPKKTIAAAMSAANPGYTVLVASGTYTGNFETTKGGSAGNFITVRSQVKHGATIVGGGKDTAVDVKHEYVRFQDFTVTGAETRNGFLISANNVEIVGNHIHHITQWKTGGTSWQGGAGVDIGKSSVSNILIDRNLIHHVGAPGSNEQLVHGMYLSAHATNGRVTNNVIHHVEDFGVHPYDDTEASGWKIINNTVAFAGRGILQAPNGVTRNNVVFNTRGADYDIRGSGNVLSNNLSFDAGEETGENGVTVADPKFVNATADDYRLQTGSPAINAGTATGAPAADFLGITRPQGSGIDIGAYEQ